MNDRSRTPLSSDNNNPHEDREDVRLKNENSPPKQGIFTRSSGYFTLTGTRLKWPTEEMKKITKPLHA